MDLKLHYDLMDYNEEDLRARLESLSTGPATWREATGWLCECDEDCPWNSMDAVEGELILREMERVR